ncbi:phospho-sugar mutase [Dermatophilus congolensis]|uniref:phospho-sugar mutase n=1 Tax=Dermatophilus congolensis TaxID=1863 RepID=UPI001AAFA7D2|nr:phospho-sugar mutase [Dermatophilus congolensis]MBO3142209.1 phospho-sugar mutase [Dermatophilus congolensis]MBO3151201.1 phospho-sugar mutase [Dermatophilus congolensis]MBO3161798.1 phospho-sugar mutase [Dermatophilus congolensis]MBO3162484.1 phospho-sugar mutase [Dermatophilus congolensis]MBO3176040.1 phospho-sugar mutase [Dermatophilus congolensis]
MRPEATPELIEHARTWAAHDPDESDRATILALADAAQDADEAAAAELVSRFSGPLMFGTAGLRAAVGAGESRMSRAVVIRATAGLVAYLTKELGQAPTVVLGCDARHGSSQFLRDAAQVVSAAGGTALVLPEKLPTPVTAFAVRRLGADAGVMITASHNPREDNGYKVYLGGRAARGAAEGVQIVPPADRGIAECIAAAPFADEVPRDEERVQHVELALWEEYVDRAASLAVSDPAPIRIVLTPMHGVGGATAVEVLRRAGFTDVHVVPEQAEPDPDFPTVAFPNPEEPGALDLALGLAQEVKADVVIALDPDADRCSVGTCGPDGWRQLTGDEIGALLGEQAAADSSRVGDTLANSIVSGRLLSRIAQAHGLQHQATLTGFKWIARTEGLRFGYEEAIGYCTDPMGVRDKDGVTAAVRVASLVSALAKQGRSISDALDDLARAHGLHATAQLSFRVVDTALIADAMARLRATPPSALAGSEVKQVADLADGYEGLAPTDGMVFITADNDRVIARPSGTEPKLKCYLEVVVPVSGEQVPRGEAAQRLELLKEDMRAAVGL